MKSESPPIFSALASGCIALLLRFVCFACIAFVALLLLFVGFVWVVGVSFSLRMIATKRKGKPLGACPLFVRGLWSVKFLCSY